MTGGSFGRNVVCTNSSLHFSSYCNNPPICVFLSLVDDMHIVVPTLNMVSFFVIIGGVTTS